MPYSVFLRPAAKRDLRSMEGKVRRRIEEIITVLSANPRPRGTKKLVGFENEWRPRIGDYRVLYVIDDSANQVTVARIAHRREAYR